MTSSFVPKEQIADYQPWEMSSFDIVDLTSKLSPEAPQQTSESSESIDDSAIVRQPSEEELAAVFSQAKDQGYSAGYEEGKSRGYEEGHTAGYAEGRSKGEIEVKEEIARMQALLSNLSLSVHEMSQTVADDLLNLALTVSKKMINHAFDIKPELIVPIVHEAMQQLPYSTQQLKLYLHPEDAKIMRAHLENESPEEKWFIREDSQLIRGGCRIVTDSSEIDATVETRWQKILSAIGQQNDWMK